MRTQVFDPLQSESEQQSKDWSPTAHVIVGVNVTVGDGEAAVGLNETVGSGVGLKPHTRPQVASAAASVAG